MKRILLFVFTALTAFSAVSCYNNDDDAPDLREKALVAILKQGDIDYWQQIGYAFTQECLSRGLTPVVLYTEDEIHSGAQVEMVKSLDVTEYNIQGIALAPIWSENDHAAEQAVADYAAEHKIPVTIVDSPIDEVSSPLKDIYVSYVGTDNEKAGMELAQKISAPTSSILVVAAEGSTPVPLRYKGIRSVKGKVDEWVTDENNVKDIVNHIDDKTTDIIFLNGHLCKDVLNELGIFNVYTFDIYGETMPLLLDSDSFIKGIVAQNTIEMGRQAVLDLLAAPKSKKHDIPVIYLDSRSIASLPQEAEPLMDYLDAHSPFKGKTVMSVIGYNTSIYWGQILSGMREMSDKLSLNLDVVYQPDDGNMAPAASAIASCGSIDNLLGVAGWMNVKEFDEACAKIPEGVHLSLLEGLCITGGGSEQRYDATVRLNNAHYAKTLLGKIPEKKLLVFSYSTGNNLFLTKEFEKLRGTSDIRPVYMESPDYVLDSLKKLSPVLDRYDAVILSAGSFVRPEVMDYLKGRPVYSSDLNATVSEYIKSGDIALNIAPDTYSFGRLAILSAITGASYEVPFILTDKSNVDSPERKKFYE